MREVKEYKRFGVMLDCSRNAVMKVSEIKRMIDYLQKMDYNVLELYTEDTYEIMDEPFFGYLRGRYKKEEIIEIDRYAQEHGIELIPCIQTLAHFTALVRNIEYAPIIDCNDILLVDEPKTYELIDKIFATLADCFTSRYVNIGMDEAHMVGLGKYLDIHGYSDRFGILLKHLNKVVEIAKKYGFKPHMWSDMFFRLVCRGEYYDPNAVFPEEVKCSVPKDITLTYWDYYHDDVDFYDRMIRKHYELTQDVWFAGGAHSWSGSFAPMNGFSLKVMKPAMQSVRKNHIKNVLITMWGDDGKECSFFAMLPALYAIRQYADGIFDEVSIKEGFKKIFDIDYDVFMLLDLPNSIKIDDLTLSNPCKCLLYNDPFLGIMDKTIECYPKIPYSDYAKQLHSAVCSVKEFSYIFNVMANLCDLLAIKAELGIKTRSAYKNRNKKELKRVIADYNKVVLYLDKFYNAFYILWHKENKPQGWEIQDARLGGLVCRLKTCAKRLKDYLTAKIDTIDELEEDVLKQYKYLINNKYVDLISKNIV